MLAVLLEGTSPQGYPEKMIALALMASASIIAPGEPLAGELRSAIWSDLQLNATIGSGNWIASLWYNAGGDEPDLHISDLVCRLGAARHHCAFILTRDGGAKTVMGVTAPDRISCQAIFVAGDNAKGWTVKHLPPRGSGHSRTTMKCKIAASA